MEAQNYIIGVVVAALCLAVAGAEQEEEENRQRAPPRNLFTIIWIFLYSYLRVQVKRGCDWTSVLHMLKLAVQKEDVKFGNFRIE